MSPFGDALASSAKYRERIERFLTDGSIEIGSSAIECTIRSIALNRKNALFAGHDSGAQKWAIIAWGTETCKLNVVDPTRG